MPFNILKEMWKKSRKSSVMLADNAIEYEITVSNDVFPVGRYKYTTVLGNWEWKLLRFKEDVV
jgi:hypothetical protein